MNKPLTYPRSTKNLTQEQMARVLEDIQPEREHSSLFDLVEAWRKYSNHCYYNEHIGKLEHEGKPVDLEDFMTWLSQEDL